MELLILAVIAAVVYTWYIVNKHMQKATKTQSTMKFREAAQAQPNVDYIDMLSISTEFDDTDSHAHFVAYTMFDVYILLSGSDKVFYRGSVMEPITKRLLDLKEYLGGEHIKKSAKYEDIIGEYNKVASEYKHNQSKLVSDTLAKSTSPDLQHCPSCSQDIGKEVSRARKCPKCGEKILIFRDIPDTRFLVNEKQNTELDAMWKAAATYKLPNVLEAFELGDHASQKLAKFIDDHKKSEDIAAKARELEIDL